MTTTPDMPEHWSALDQLNMNLTTIREALDEIQLRGFFFREEAIGGRPFLRVGMMSFDGFSSKMLWSKPRQIHGRIVAFDVAAVAVDAACDLARAEIRNRFTFEGRQIFLQGG